MLFEYVVAVSLGLIALVKVLDYIEFKIMVANAREADDG